MSGLEGWGMGDGGRSSVDMRNCNLEGEVSLIMSESTRYA